jgi:prepilin signal peptidase PulO-like enzyme (type II secretory pathway)
MILTYVFIYILGSVIGSFLSSYTYRIVTKKSVLKGRSFCPECKKKIAWYDNVPILSYLSLKGRCRNCGKKISLRYPLLELSTGLLFLGAFVSLQSCFGSAMTGGMVNDGVVCSWGTASPIIGLLSLLVLLSSLGAIFIIDIEHMIIPDSLIFPLLLIVYLFFAIYFSQETFLFLLTGLVAALFLLFLHLITFGKGMGLGDVKFAIIGGFILGPQLTLVWLFLSFVLGAVVGVFFLLLGRTKFGKQIPFGPFLVISFILVIFKGPLIYNLLDLPFKDEVFYKK